MTTEQQEIISNSIWIVNSALKKQHLQCDRDLRQSAILYMCECLLRFDPNKGIKWTTYAYKNVYLYIMRKHKEETQVNRQLESINEFYALKSPIETSECVLVEEYPIEELLCILTPKEREILGYFRNGLRGAEISSELNCSLSRVYNLLQSIKRKAREITNGKNRKM